MPFRAIRVLVPVLVFSILLLAALLLVMDHSFQATTVAGYPGQGEGAGATSTSGPYPGPNTPGPHNPPLGIAYSPTPLNATPHYLPHGGRQVPFQFSVGGANGDQVAAVVPDQVVAIDGNDWRDVPSEGRLVQMARRCKAGLKKRYMCWIVNDWLQNADGGDITRSNLASISTPEEHDPVASSTFMVGDIFTDSRATDGITNTRWASDATTTVDFTVPNLQPVDLYEIVIDWWRGSAQNITGTYAKSYTIEAFFKKVGQDDPAWHTIYSTTAGADAEKHTINTFSGYNNEFVSAVRLTMTERGETTNDSYKYAMDELEIYGRVEDQFFLRAEDSEVTTPEDTIDWWADYLSNNPGQIWLIGNEPDNFDHGRADGMRTEDYAHFYARAAIFLRERDPAAQIIFCQGTFAQSPFYPTSVPPTPTPGSPTPVSTPPQFPHGYGPEYCGFALEILRDDILPGTAYSLTDLIDGFATHQYFITKIDNSTVRATEISSWQSKLDHFAGWVNSYSDDGLDGRPLYLTEYGDYDNDCTPTPGPGTPEPNLPDGCGTREEWYAWFGDSHDEGFWAIQFHTTDYFLETCFTPNQADCNAQWLGAWWFFVGNQPQDAAIGGMFFSINVLDQNPNAWRYRDAINCHLNGQSCTVTPTSTPTPTPTSSSGGIGG